MYKYESYLKETLLHEGEMSLSQIGVFTLSKEPFVSNDGASSSMQKIIFLYDKKAETSAAFISFIAEKEKKNKQIVALDVESYLNEIRQLINTGKELPLEGLGYLFINKQGEYEFVQQASSVSKNEDGQKKKKQKSETVKISPFAEKQKKQRSGTSFLMVVFIFLLAAAAAWGIYYLFSKNNETANNASQNNAVIVPDSSQQQNAVQPVDTISKKATDSAVNKTDSVLYKFIFETTSDSTRANSRLAKLKVYGDPAAMEIVHTDSGALYRLYLLKKILPADSTAAKDSVQNYFQRNVIIEKVIK